jgi:hypothetical protein
VVPEIILTCLVEVSATLIHLMERMTSGGCSSLPHPDTTIIGKSIKVMHVNKFTDLSL